MKITKEIFGRTASGEEIFAFKLQNKSGMNCTILNYGAIIQSLKVQAKDGSFTDIVLGYDTLAEYVSDTASFGAAIGRFGNRIGGGRFELEGKEYCLIKNDGDNHLHGGIEGFAKKVWDADVVKEGENKSLQLIYLSKDGEEGYPGNLKVKLSFTLTDENELKYNYAAETDRSTIISLTHHSYFNLNGSGSVLDQELMINADFFLPVNGNTIPTGEIKNNEQTTFDFRQAKKIGRDIDIADRQLKIGNGYDHNFVINEGCKGLKEPAAAASSQETGIRMELYTSAPGLQLYTGNSIARIFGKNDLIYKDRHAFCLEPQFYPDTPNHTHFPSCILKPGESFVQENVIRFLQIDV